MKKEVLDPQGKVVSQTLKNMGYKNIINVKKDFNISRRYGGSLFNNYALSEVQKGIFRTNTQISKNILTSLDNNVALKEKRLLTTAFLAEGNFDYATLENDLINSIKSNKNLHPTLKTSLPQELKIEKYEKLNSYLKNDPDIIVVGVSSVGIDWFVEQIADHFKNKQRIVLLTKGLSIVNNELTTISEKIKNLLEKKGHKNLNISAIKGPCCPI